MSSNKPRASVVPAAVVAAAPVAVPVVPQLRVRVFVDFWNFTLELKRRDPNINTDWSKIGPLLATRSAALVNPGMLPAFEGMHVFGSYDPSKPADAKFRHWFTNVLDRMPGVHATHLPRQPKRSYPRCPACQAEVSACGACQSDMRGTEEKGVDTRMVTEMMGLAWANAYDVAVLVSADKDFVPVADYLQAKGVKVVHGAFPPKGSQLSQRCWGSVDIAQLVPEFSR